MDFKGNLNKVEIKMEKGITLIALIVTIIVLIILAGISLSMLMGDNGIIRYAIEARDKTDIANLEEELNLLYQGEFFNGNLGKKEVFISDIIDKIEKEGYEIKRVTTSMKEIKKVELSSSSLSMGVDETKTTKYIITTEEGEALVDYYVKLRDHKFHKITLENNNFVVNKEGTVNMNSSEGNEEKNIQVELEDNNIATVTLENDNTISLKGKNSGTTDINITINGQKFTKVGTIEVVGEISIQSFSFTGEIEDDIVTIAIGSVAQYPKRFKVNTYPENANEKWSYEIIGNTDNLDISVSGNQFSCGVQSLEEQKRTGRLLKICIHTLDNRIKEYVTIQYIIDVYIDNYDGNGQSKSFWTYCSTWQEFISVMGNEANLKIMDGKIVTKDSTEDKLKVLYDYEYSDKTVKPEDKLKYGFTYYLKNIKAKMEFLDQNDQLYFTTEVPGGVWWSDLCYNKNEVLENWESEDKYYWESIDFSVNYDNTISVSLWGGGYYDIINSETGEKVRGDDKIGLKKYIVRMNNN